ncbi:MAG: pilus assembly protein PilM [Candidatus Omnitrophica bacterium]|nr:pilus assembly protein PilM [Candidatus Omnitrophota bacterium]
MEFKKIEEVIGVDFSGEEFIFARLKINGKKKEFDNFTTYNIKGLSDDEVAKILEKTCQDLKIKNPFIVNVIPQHLAITKNLEIPSVDAREIKEIINLQSGRQTPYSREEIVVDYASIGTFRHSYTKILLAIVPRNTIKRQCEIIQKAGFRLEKILFAPEGIAQVCRTQLKGDLLDNPIGIVHINLNFTDFIVAVNGAASYTRSIPLGVKHYLEKTDEFMGKLVEELKKSLEAYQAEDIGTAVQLLFLTGAIEQLADLSAILAAQLHVPNKVLLYLGLLPLNQKVLTASTINKHVSFFGVTAALMCLRSIKIDLIPEEIKLKRAFDERIQQLIHMSVYIGIILVLCGSIFMSKFYFENVYLERLKIQHETLAPEAEILEKSMTKARIIKHYIRNRGHSLKVIEALYEILPKRIMLTDIKMDIEGKLNLKGTARAMSDVFTFVVALEESEFFSNVQTNYTSSRKEKDEDWADFGISCLLVKR